MTAPIPINPLKQHFFGWKNQLMPSVIMFDCMCWVSSAETDSTTTYKTIARQRRVGATHQ